MDVNQLTDYYYDMADHGKWKEGLRFMADAYARFYWCAMAFRLSQTCRDSSWLIWYLNDYYITAPQS